MISRNKITIAEWAENDNVRTYEMPGRWAVSEKKPGPDEDEDSEDELEELDDYDDFEDDEDSEFRKSIDTNFPLSGGEQDEEE